MKKTIKLIIIITIALGYTYQIIQLNRQPLIGIHVSDNESGDYYVRATTSVGWAFYNGIEHGDIIELINGESPNKFSVVLTDNRIEGAETITIRRADQLETYEVGYSTELLQQLIIYTLIPFIHYVISLIVGITLLKNYTQKSALLLGYLTLLLGTGYMGASLSIRIITLGFIIVDFSLLVIPILFLHFVYCYMEENGVGWFSKKIIYLLYTIALIIFGGVTFKLLTNNVKNLLLLTFVFFLLTIAVILTIGFFRIKNRKLKRIYSWIFKTLVIAISPYLFLHIIPFLIWEIYFLSAEIAILFTFTLPIVFLYLLVTGKMYLIKVHIRQLTYYLSLSLLLILLVSGIYYIVPDVLVNGLTAGWKIFLGLFFLMFTLYFKSFLDRLLRAALFVEKDYYQRSIYRFSECLKSENSTVGILKMLKREVDDVLNTNQDLFFDIAKQDKLKADVEPQYRQLVKQMQSKGASIGTVMQVGAAFGVIVGEKEHDYIAFMGMLSRHRLLSRDQYEWLSTLAYYTSVSLENIEKIEALLVQLKHSQSSGSNWINRLIFNWSEDERRKLASDIHDSFLQDIIILKRKIDDLKDHAEQAFVQRELIELEESIEDVIFNIRETCNELAPSLLSDLGLKATLMELMDKFNLRSNILLSICFKANFNEDLLSVEYKNMLYRTIQELLNNAVKHSRAEEVEVFLSTKNGCITLDYIDDGVGMEITNNETKSNGMGIFGIKERIHSFNGSITFTSITGQGLKVATQIPLA
ncbi:two-component system, NarL family, sensor histidine kinase ComP [Amphibacillus marinus]|uniref:histidine kinase n=1 Tax=Amphibacillus marinus TaxID=872970 RepID=A0A1H8KBV6_9BACI|nr:ATP-binding protein [Amphibacillus marinus]SEN90460.1 two-component system, NarL family, sensor histidine kinase ComP [Amphibacillus marinus]